MEVSYIVVVSRVVVTMIVVWWDMENVSHPPYDLLECSHVFLEHILVFHHKEIWACSMCKCLSKCLHMGASKDYLKLFILLSPNHASAYNIVVALHHHLVKNNSTSNILSV
jgi:hypothetical protein